jgi:dipeptidyl aminopeptidase/acylaminoacyl peptidase
MTKRKIQVEDICSFKFVSDPRFNPDGKGLAYVLSEADVDKNGYKSSIFYIDEKKEVKQLTNSVSDKLVKDTSPRWSPDGKYLAFISNRSGQNKVYILPADGGEAKVLVDFPAGAITWAPDSKCIAFVAKDPKKKEEVKNADRMHFTDLRYKFNGQGYFTDKRKSHIWVVNVENGEVEQITDTKFDDSSPAFSPDGDNIVFVSTRHKDETNLWSDLYQVNVENKETTRLTDHNGPASSPVYSPCGKYIAFVGHDKDEEHAANQNVWILKTDGSGMVNLTLDYDRSVNGGPGSDVRYGGGNNEPIWKGDSSAIIFRIGDKGTSKIVQVDLKGNVSEITNFKHGISSYDATEENGQLKLAYVAETLTQSPEIYTFLNGKQTKMTGANDDFLAQFDFAPVHNFTYKSAKDWDIEGWLLEPLHREEGKKYPVVLEIHGGPAAAYGWSFYHEFYLLSAMGYGVLFTNPRGSRTYGEEFTNGVIGDWGGHDYDDVINGTKYAIENFDWVDENRLGVTGGSYGGYLANWMVTQTDMYKAAVSLRSISNLYTKYGVSDIGWYGNRRGMGGADLWDQEDFIMSRSAIRFAPNVKTPILLIHSMEDYRCPFEQAEQFYVALKRLGNAPTELLVFKGENHELSRSGKPLNRMDRLRGIVDWFERYLK